MAHVAKVDDGGVVREVLVVNNSDLPNAGEFTPEVEAAANDYLHGLGLDGDWKLTSYNGNFRRCLRGSRHDLRPDTRRVR